jgi:hypothetical protein
MMSETARLELGGAEFVPLRRLSLISRWAYGVRGSSCDDQGRYSSYLSTVCFTFERQALQEVIDYRGSHGVRLVYKCVVDYNGLWLGPTGLSDSTVGAVQHMGEAFETSKKEGTSTMSIDLGAVPAATTDIYFIVHSPPGEHSVHPQVRLSAQDADRPGFEVAQFSYKLQKNQVEVYRLSRCGAGDRWSFAIGSAPGAIHSGEYQDALLMLRSLQAQRHGQAGTIEHAGDQIASISERLGVRTMAGDCDDKMIAQVTQCTASKSSLAVQAMATATMAPMEALPKSRSRGKKGLPGLGLPPRGNMLPSLPIY